MKHFLFLSFVLVSILGFAQKQTSQTHPLFISSNTINNFDDIYARLNAISESITETNFQIKRIDEIRQGQLIISTENIGKSLQNVKIDTRPSLDVELQRIMYTGTFPNPRQRRPIIIKY